MTFKGWEIRQCLRRAGEDSCALLRSQIDSQHRAGKAVARAVVDHQGGLLAGREMIDVDLPGQRGVSPLQYRIGEEQVG